MDNPTPFINSSLLPNYRGQVVRITGKVTKQSGRTLLIQTSDLGSVEVGLQPDTELADGVRFVEVLGKVADSGESIREFTAIDLGDGVDMNLVERVVGISQKFPQLFTQVSD